MSGNIQFELQFQIMGLITGAGLMLSYDVLRVLRIFIPHHFVWIGIEDMIYWIYAALVTYTLLYRLNDGGIRGYVVAAALVGMIAYDRLISRFFLKILENGYNMLQNKLKYFKMKLSRHKKQRTDKAGD
ncbi:spore cortex biosynthesis protein YabQ [Clostridium sp. chh4-2]|uniref:spore cortex biosynthesis protein YabQ n=1 Tax=Clostridium sp. chh4-2 TaxID=2067550 RepID=UPI000CCE6DB8|nr:spore cortex biosynthesis protein YabQ [Clostridium sp. chh4-2]PNV62425.1 spore cortex biosynthesis protein YabQ [Clostridium sp. chh4-2]